MVVASTPRVPHRRRRQSGFTYLVQLFAVAVLGIGLVAASEVWVTTAQRQKTEQLKWVGGQFTQAIGSYYESSPGPVKQYPAKLDELLDDRRSPAVRRHLREIYPNPFAGKPDWELVRTADARIMGVRGAAAGHDTRAKYEFIYRVPP